MTVVVSSLSWSLVLISSDNHGGANLFDYKPYLEKKWHAEFDQWAKQYSNPWEFLDPRVPDDEEDLLVAASSWHSPLNWDSAKRIAHMESNGVVAEVVFRGAPKPADEGKDPLWQPCTMQRLSRFRPR
jgi:hypothetical protein